MNEPVYLLGAPDPEMAEIERVLRAIGRGIAYAVADGKRATPATAYRTEAALPPMALDGYVTVECSAPAGAVVVGCIDHHRPGDPGYGLPPAEYMAGSSLGQLLARLGLEPTPEQRLIAAADHCLTAAYAGQCPGVDPDALMHWRAQARAGFQRRAVAEVLADIDLAIAVLQGAPFVVIAGEEVADLRGRSVPELPEAAARIGRGFLASMTERGRMKMSIMGAGSDAVAAWMSSAAADGLTGIYGDPARGFAGGYAPA